MEAAKNVREELLLAVLLLRGRHPQHECFSLDALEKVQWPHTRHAKKHLRLTTVLTGVAVQTVVSLPCARYNEDGLSSLFPQHRKLLWQGSLAFAEQQLASAICASNSQREVVKK